MDEAATTGSHEIFEAIASGDADRVREVVARDPAAASARDADGVSAVLQARYRDRTDMVDALLASRPELDVFDAAALGGVERVRELIEGDAALAHAWSPDGFTPLHLGVFFGHADVTRLLVDRGADLALASRNRMEVMPLHSAVAGRHRAVVEILLGAGAPVNARTHGGFTPLIEAAQNGDLEIVDLLLARGADPSARTDAGASAVDVARDEGHLDVADRLAGSG